MSHLRHRTIYKKLPRGPIFIDSSIVTEIYFIYLFYFFVKSTIGMHNVQQLNY